MEYVMVHSFWMDQDDIMLCVEQWWHDSLNEVSLGCKQEMISVTVKFLMWKHEILYSEKFISKTHTLILCATCKGQNNLQLIPTTLTTNLFLLLLRPLIIMTTDRLKNVMELFEVLKKEFTAGNLQKSGELLTQLKIALTQLSFLNGSLVPDNRELLITREVLEIGAQWSIQAKDIASFERYFAQLKTYYTDYKDKLPQSQRTYPLTGLNLLRLLAQNRIAEFHTEIEQLDTDLLLNNIYIKHPIQVEQCLMEGSYNKVWNSRNNVPAQEYLLFMDILVATIRHEIASCAERAYTQLPLADAATLLHFKTEQEILNFCQGRSWKVEQGKIVFGSNAVDIHEVPSTKIMSNALEYAKELERIV